MKLPNPVLTPTALEVTYLFDASIERVFRAWTEPELMKQWVNPAPDGKVTLVEVDLQEGGQYRIVMGSQKGDDFAVGGQYQEVNPPHRLVYTWRWEHSPPEIPETLVTLDFTQVGEQTKVRLLHEGFATEKGRDNHADGWQGCVSKLYQLLDQN